MAAAWILTASFLFSLMGAGVKLASAAYSINEIVMYRGLVGVCILYGIARHHNGSLATKIPASHLTRSAVGLASMWLWYFSMSRLPLATAVTLNYMSPVWTAAFLVLLAWWQRRRGVEWQLLVAIGVSFAGVVLAMRPAFESRQWLGGLAALASGMLAAVAYMLIRRLSRLGEPEYRVVFYLSAMSTVAGFAGAMLEPGGFHRIDWYGGALLGGVALTGTLAQIALTRAYHQGKTLVVANLQYTGIVFSSAWGILLWGDLFDWHVWLGMAMILGSSLAATFFNSRATA
jgi:drug/metabolite transporter (DMT)-like permease